MGRKASPGLRKRGDIWHIDKKMFGQRIQQSTGTSDLKEAELIFAKTIDEVRRMQIYGVRRERTFREAATRYLEENLHLRSISDSASHLKVLDPFIGSLKLNEVHMGTLKPFIQARQAAGRKNKTINLALGVVRRVLNLSARLWRDENNLAWLETVPMIQLLPLDDARRPYPLSWQEQQMLFRQLPDHLATMCLFKVNTGCREQEVCQLRWDWECSVPEIGASVFMIPREFVKNKEDRIVVLNSIARSVIDEQRGKHEEFVFTRRGRPVTKINNSAWRRARCFAGLFQVRVHDLKHTFGRRLRAAGVPLETRKVLLGHTNGDITSHYSAPEFLELIRAVERISVTAGKTPALTLIRQVNHGQEVKKVIENKG